MEKNKNINNSQGYENNKESEYYSRIFNNCI